MLHEDKVHEVVNILVVEDDKIDVEFIRRLFRKENIKNPVYHAENGIQALEIMRGENDKDKIPKPFIVLLDINMPKMNGIELLRELRKDENLKDCIVFVLTTSPRTEDKDITYKLNVAGYFLKNDIRELTNLLSIYWRLNEFP